jgi:hypothetical protein
VTLGLALVGAAALCPPVAARPLLLPSPVLPLDSRVPLRTDAPPAQLQLPLNARMDSRERVLVDALPDGRVVGLRVVQRLTLTGTGDYFLSIPAPLLDVRAAPGSQAEPGFRRSGILWQGFANRRRVLAAAGELDPERAAPALPLRLELTVTVDGQPLMRTERRSGRLRLVLKLRNTTAVRVQMASARPVRSGDVRRITSRIVSQVRGGQTPQQPVLQVEGPIQTRRVVVDAPLVVVGEVRLPVRGLDAAVVGGGSLVRRGGEVVIRFQHVLTGPEHATATIALTGSVRDAAYPHASLTAEPSAAAAIANQTVRGNPRAAADAAGRLLLRLARARQYDAFLANPAPGGEVHAVYQFRTVAQAPPAVVPAPASDGRPGVLPAAVVVLSLLGVGALVVLWAHL